MNILIYIDIKILYTLKSMQIAQRIKQVSLPMMSVRNMSSLDYTYYVKKMFPIPRPLTMAIAKNEQEQICQQINKKNRQQVVFLDYTYYMYENPTKKNETKS